MKTIDLECPGCDAVLELDRGFAGGVCRCSDCGTLMTVPADPAVKAERLERPESPGNPGSPTKKRPERPDAPKRTSRGAAKPPRKKTGQPSKTSPEKTQGPQTFRTESGRTITIEHLDRVPMAPAKRHAVRAATILGFVVVVGGVLALCGFAAFTMISAPSADSLAALSHVETFSYDAGDDPFTIKEPNFFGLPLSNRVAVIYDTTSLDSAQLRAVNALLLDGLKRPAPAVRMTVMISEADGRFWTLVDGEALGASAIEPLGQQLDQLAADAEDFAVLSAAESIVEGKPQIVILVTGRDVADAEASALQKILPEDTRLDVVMIDADSYGLEDAARETDGRYITLESDDELVRWGS